MRQYAIMLKNNDRDVIANIVDQIQKFDKESKIWIFGRNFDEGFSIPENVIIHEVPEDVFEIDSKFHNFIVKFFIETAKTDEGASRGFLHVFHDNLGVNSEKMSVFVSEIEQFMKIFQYDVWLNTETDICNYIFNKWISRIDIVNDNPDLLKKYPKVISWASNANTNYIVYDLDVLKLDDVLFDESFTIAMFYIIKFFATRRNNHRPGSFMNFYPSIESERGCIADMKYSSKEDFNNDERMKNEDKIFKEMNVDFHPTENVEEVLEFMVSKLENA